MAFLAKINLADEIQTTSTEAKLLLRVAVFVTVQELQLQVRNCFKLFQLGPPTDICVLGKQLKTLYNKRSYLTSANEDE